MHKRAHTRTHTQNHTLLLPHKNTPSTCHTASDSLYLALALAKHICMFVCFASASPTHAQDAVNHPLCAHNKMLKCRMRSPELTAFLNTE